MASRRQDAQLSLLEMLGVRLLVAGAIGAFMLAVAQLGGEVGLVVAPTVLAWCGWSALTDAYIALSRATDGS